MYDIMETYENRDSQVLLLPPSVDAEMMTESLEVSEKDCQTTEKKKSDSGQLFSLIVPKKVGKME